MALSPEAKMIDDIAVTIRDAASQISTNLPQVASALYTVAGQLGVQGEMYEKNRVDSIIAGTHPALGPIKRLLMLQALAAGESSVYLRRDLALEGLLVDSPDETFLEAQHTVSANKKLFKRFLGAWFRRLYLFRGVEADCNATSMFERTTRRDIPYGFTIKDGNLVVKFEDTAKAFEHTLTFGKYYQQHSVNTYHVKSLWMDEEISGVFNTIGWMWLQQYIMAPVCVAYGMTLADFQPVSEEALLEQVKAIEGIDSLNHWNTTTMYYPGDPRESLSPCRVTISYKYFSGDDVHRLIIRVYPDTDLINFGLNGSPHQTDLSFEMAPTPIQQWIQQNVNKAITATIEEIKAEYNA